MSVFQPKDWLDRLFAISITIKGLDGLAEVVAGAFLLFLQPAQISRFVTVLTRGELQEDPDDFIARHLIAAAQNLGSHELAFVAIYLLAHGLIKIVLVAALLRNKLWAYPWMIAALIAFIAYQLYEIVLDPRASLIALTAFDLLVVILTVREYRVQKRRARSSPDNTP